MQCPLICEAFMAAGKNRKKMLDIGERRIYFLFTASRRRSNLHLAPAGGGMRVRTSNGRLAPFPADVPACEARDNLRIAIDQGGAI
jgi:hypothetical protein